MKGTIVTDGVYDLTPDQDASRILIQFRVGSDFVTVLDRWRAPRNLSRAKAVLELASLGLAGEYLKSNRKAIRQRAAELQAFPKK